MLSLTSCELSTSAKFKKLDQYSDTFNTCGFVLDSNYPAANYYASYVCDYPLSRFCNIERPLVAGDEVNFSVEIKPLESFNTLKFAVYKNESGWDGISGWETVIPDTLEKGTYYRIDHRVKITNTFNVTDFDHYYIRLQSELRPEDDISSMTPYSDYIYAKMNVEVSVSYKVDVYTIQDPIDIPKLFSSINAKKLPKEMYKYAEFEQPFLCYSETTSWVASPFNIDFTTASVLMLKNIDPYELGEITGMNLFDLNGNPLTPTPGNMPTGYFYCTVHGTPAPGNHAYILFGSY